MKRWEFGIEIEKIINYDRVNQYYFIGEIHMGELPFNTLLPENKCSSSERWYPHGVESYRSAFIISDAVENKEVLLSNLAYSMQYIEFLEKELNELTLSSVVRTMLIKTYVITAMSVLEGVFCSILKENKLWKTDNLESLGTVTANEKKISGEKLIVRTELLRKVDTYPLRMDLQAMIDVLKGKHELLGVNHLVYPALKRLKNLRNRVHLQKLEDDKMHDYNAFTDSIKKEMGNILHEILISPAVTRRTDLFDFLQEYNQ